MFSFKQAVLLVVFEKNTGIILLFQTNYLFCLNKNIWIQTQHVVSCSNETTCLMLHFDETTCLMLHSNETKLFHTKKQTVYVFVRTKSKHCFVLICSNETPNCFCCTSSKLKYVVSFEQNKSFELNKSF
jgi:hypothetical protein